MAGSSTRVRSTSGSTTASSSNAASTGGGGGGHQGRFGRHRTGGRQAGGVSTTTAAAASTTSDGGGSTASNNINTNTKTSSVINTNSSSSSSTANTSNGNNGGSNNSNKRKNVSFLLARGGTARGLPSHLILSLTPLRPDEMEKDLRHMQVYANAVQSYQQQFYLHCNQGMLLAEQQQQLQQQNATAAAAVNGSTADATGLGVVPGMAVASNVLAPTQQHYNAQHHPSSPMMATGAVVMQHHHMPIRIDPEEEKRLLTLRKKITKAEVLREEAESQYVASRAHYVHEVQRVATATSSRKRILTFLQTAVQSKAKVVALQRVRLQMARDVLNALLLRRQQQQQNTSTATASVDLLPADAVAPTAMTTVTTATTEAMEIDSTADEAVAAAAAPAVAASGVSTTTTTSASTIPPHLSGDDPMALQWNAIEDEYKKAATACIVDKKTKKAMPWPCTHLPVTPRGVPILLSSMSRAPDKTIAFALSCKNGSATSSSSKKQSLVWVEDNLPLDHYRVTEQGKNNSNISTITPAASKKSDQSLLPPQHQPDEFECELPTLSQRVKALERELVKERQLNQELCHKIGQSRKHADECVAFLSILRQETEAVVQRHNTLLESDTAMEALERLQDEGQDDGDEEEMEEEENPDHDAKEHHDDTVKDHDGEGASRRQEKDADGAVASGVESATAPSSQPPMASASAEGNANGGTTPLDNATATTTTVAATNDDVPSLDHVPRKKAVDKDTSSSSDVAPVPPLLALASAPGAIAVADEEANDGDDEDSNEEGEVQEDDDEEEGEVQEDTADNAHNDWEAPVASNNNATISSNNNNKRSAVDEPEKGRDDNNDDDSPGRKRRKL